MSLHRPSQILFRSLEGSQNKVVMQGRILSQNSLTSKIYFGQRVHDRFKVYMADFFVLFAR